MSMRPFGTRKENFLPSPLTPFRAPKSPLIWGGRKGRGGSICDVHCQGKGVKWGDQFRSSLSPPPTYGYATAVEMGGKGGWRERATGLTSTKRKEEKENSFGNRNLPNKEEKEEEEGSNKKGKEEEEEDFIWDSVSPSLQSSSSFLITY